MPRMKHKDVLTAIRAAGYHGDKERGRLLYIKNWVSLMAYRREFDLGAAMRQNGVTCDCAQCRNGETNWVNISPSQMRLPGSPELDGPSRTGGQAPLPGRIREIQHDASGSASAFRNSLL